MENTKRKTILIVENNLIIAMALEQMVSNFGYNPIGNVSTGKKAIKSANNLQPDLILMDIILEGPINGITATKSIKEEIEIPVIFLTGNSDRHILAKAKETNFIDFLIKPVQKNQLKRSINKAF